MYLRTGLPEADARQTLEAAPVIPALGLGLAVFNTGQSFFTSGNLSFRSTVARYVHEPPAPDPFTAFTGNFEISARHPEIVFGRQHFWFRLSFEYNGFDLSAVAIRLLEDRSSRMVTSEFEVTFEPQPNSSPSTPVAKILYQISGRWDPVGLGVDSFWGRLEISADGTARLNVDSEQHWVRHEGFSNVRRVALGPPRTQRPPAPQAPQPRSGPGRSTLRRGSRGPEVRELQQRLNFWLRNQGQPGVVVDGIFGSATQRAVRTVQRMRGLRPDGIVGPETWARLTAA